MEGTERVMERIEPGEAMAKGDASEGTEVYRGVFHFWASDYGEMIPAATLLGHLIARFQWNGTVDEAAICIDDA